jgi:hypothetical protein
MFDMRLGLVLKKSVEEIRMLPYPEYRDWWLMYLVEPWGWWNEEVNTSRILTAIHNANVTKSKDLKEPEHFMRDMPKMIIESLRKQAPPELDSMNDDEKRAFLLERIKRDLGAF